MTGYKTQEIVSLIFIVFIAILGVVPIQRLAAQIEPQISQLPPQQRQQIQIQLQLIKRLAEQISQLPPQQQQAFLDEFHTIIQNTLSRSQNPQLMIELLRQVLPPIFQQTLPP
jgi:hypothetical protein